LTTVSIPLFSRKYPGHVALIDEADYPLVVGYRWHTRPADDRWYAYAHVPGSGKTGKNIFLHRLLMGTSPDVLIDHINRNGLDCRRENMRPATTGQNNANARKHVGSVSPYKGVSWQSRSGKWRANVACDGRRIHCGYFEHAEDAARAYDVAALALWGEYALTNSPASTYSDDDIRAFREQLNAQKGTSPYRGVRTSRNGKWEATLFAFDVRYHLGTFDEEVAAARAYDTKVRELRGPTARVNFPDD